MVHHFARSLLVRILELKVRIDMEPKKNAFSLKIWKVNHRGRWAFTREGIKKKKVVLLKKKTN